eukprot:tig00021127_g18813.t1
MSRPEEIGPPEIFYNETEAKKYTTNSRIQEIQARMTNRALELLNLPPDQPSLVLDIGCGSGLSGDVLAENGHTWVGIDISKPMLEVAVEREVDGDLFLWDMGEGLSFRTGVFDGAISISALQWLCNADKKGHEPHKRLRLFFNTLYKCLARGARAVLQVYPNGPDQMNMITTAAMRCGFSGGLVVDYPNSTRAKKFFLCLFAGSATTDGRVEMPKAKGVDGEGSDSDEEEEEEEGPRQARFENRAKGGKSHYKTKEGKRASVKSRDWVLNKKERQRTQGKHVRPDSKYTGRKRQGAF